MPTATTSALVSRLAELLASERTALLGVIGPRAKRTAHELELAYKRIACAPIGDLTSAPGIRWALKPIGSPVPEIVCDGGTPGR